MKTLIFLKIIKYLNLVFLDFRLVFNMTFTTHSNPLILPPLVIWIIKFWRIRCAKPFLVATLTIWVLSTILECRTQLTSTLRWSWLILLILLSVTIHASTGSATLCTNTESLEDSHLPVKSTEDFVERDTWTTSNAHQEGLPGRGTILCPFAVTVDNLCNILVLSFFDLLLYYDLVILNFAVWELRLRMFFVSILV